jgi:hypothetical protein
MFDSGEFDIDVAQGTPSLGSIAMLLAVDPRTLSRDEAVAGAVGVQLAQRLLAATGMRFQAQAGGSAPTEGQVDEAAAELSAATGAHPWTAATGMRRSRAVVGRLPVTLKSLEAGEISERQAEAVERALRGLDVADAQAVEAAAVPGSPRRLGFRLTREIARVAPELLKKRAEQKRAARMVENWSDPVEGVTGFAVQGPLAQVAQIKAAIDLEARPRVAGECRPIGARRFDVLLDWARRRLGLSKPASGSEAGKVAINVTMSAETLLRLSEAPGELAGYGPIPAEVARELAADGQWRRWLFEPTGRLADVGGRTYRPSAGLDRYVRGRDRTCRFPTCTVPAERCDLDHTLAFHTEDGETTAGNLVVLCRHHHRLKHETDWSYAAQPNGDVVWTAPSGRSYTTAAEDHADDGILSAFIAECHRKERSRREKQQKNEQPPDDGAEPPF